MRSIGIVLTGVLLSLFGVAAAAAQSITISGYVRESGTQESLPGASVRVVGQPVGTTTNHYGFYSLTLRIQPSASPPPSFTLAYSSLGYSPTYATVAKTETRSVELMPTASTLTEVSITAPQERISEQSQMSRVSVPMEQIRQMPVLLGEKDVIKALQLMPGVQKGNEGQTGLYVRGGGPDQNLILLDDAVIYNASHLFGFFSIFNNDALKSVELIKGGFPARYGGRISSVIDLQMKEGSRRAFGGEASLGLLSAKLLLQGPLSRKKPSSWLVSARRSFLDLLVGFPARFYDLNAKANVDLNATNRLYLSGYFGRDAFGGGGSAGNSGGINWGNASGTLRWNHQFSPRLFANTSLIMSQYRFKVYNKQQSNAGNFSFDYTSGIRDLTLKHDLDWLPNPTHTLRAGALLTNHRFTPNARVQRIGNVDTSNVDRIKINATEAAVYVEDDIRLASWLRANLGLRGVAFNVRGRTYTYAEPRVSLALSPLPNWAFKASYARMSQYMHLLSNSGLGLPTDLWVPATDRVAPQYGWQAAVGVAGNLPRQNLTLTVEGYYKEMQNLIGYREGASFLAVDLEQQASQSLTDQAQTDWEANVTSGRGRSYGMEVLLQRKSGRLTGWLGYTLSWTIHQFADLNGGREFYPKYDRRHDASVVVAYKLKPRITLSGNWVYGTGNNITVPLGRYTAMEGGLLAGMGGGQGATLYSDRFAFRAAPYHRLDLGVQFHRQTRRGNTRTWELSAYNVYNRINPFYYETRQDNFSNRSELYRRGLFSIIPSVSYAVKF